MNDYTESDLFKNCSGFWYHAFTVKIRRHIGLKVKPECEAIDGQTYFFRYG